MRQLMIVDSNRHGFSKMSPKQVTPAAHCMILQILSSCSK